jgi:hypothetical protein
MDRTTARFTGRPRTSPIEIDHMHPPGPGACVLPGEVQGVAVGPSAGEVTLNETHGDAVLQIDGGKELHLLKPLTPGGHRLR